MIQKLKTIALTLAASVTMLAPATLSTAAVYAARGGGGGGGANIQGSLCGGADNIDITSTSSNCNANAQDKVSSLLQEIVNIFSAIVGVIAVIMIIVGGLRYITSGGDTNKVASAKTTLIYAIIGLIIVALAQVIVRFVIGKSEQTFS